jgi:hypothetical protein
MDPPGALVVREQQMLNGGEEVKKKLHRSGVEVDPHYGAR